MKDYLVQYLDEARLTELVNTGEWVCFIRYLIHEAMTDELYQFITGQRRDTSAVVTIPLLVFPVGGGGQRMHELYVQEGHFKRQGFEVLAVQNIVAWMRQDPRKEELRPLQDHGATSALIVEDLINTGQACLKVIKWVVEHAQELQIVQLIILAELDLHPSGPLAHIARRWETALAYKEGTHYHLYEVNTTIVEALTAQRARFAPPGVLLGDKYGFCNPLLIGINRRRTVLQHLQFIHPGSVSERVREFLEFIAQKEEELGIQLEDMVTVVRKRAFWSPGQEFLILDRLEIIRELWQRYRGT